VSRQLVLVHGAFHGRLRPQAPMSFASMPAETAEFLIDLAR
jgi:hypothetical protein